VLKELMCFYLVGHSDADRFPPSSQRNRASGGG
jgi:hypothetical protein